LTQNAAKPFGHWAMLGPAGRNQTTAFLDGLKGSHFEGGKGGRVAGEKGQQK